MTNPTPAAAARTLILMADTRSPLETDYLAAPYHALAAVINLGYAKRQGYDFRYCLVGNADGPADRSRIVSDPWRQNGGGYRGAAPWRSRISFTTDLWVMAALRHYRALFVGSRWTGLGLSRAYARFRKYVLRVAEPDAWSNLQKVNVACHHHEWGPRAAPWSKLLAIRDALNQGYDRVVYIDSDAIFALPLVSVDEFLSTTPVVRGPNDPCDADLMVTISHPFREVANSGFMIWQNTPDARRLIRQWWDTDAGDYNLQHDYEQRVLLHNIFPDQAKAYAGRIAVLDTVSFLERKGQYVRHIASPHGWERVPRFRWELRQRRLIGEAYTSLVEQLRRSHITKLDPSTVPA